MLPRFRISLESELLSSTPLTTKYYLDSTATMSREQYTPPSLSQQGQASGSGTGGFNITGQGSTFEDTSKPVHYLCGDCDNKVVLKKGDPIRCKECGYRVLYKERTNR